MGGVPLSDERSRRGSAKGDRDLRVVSPLDDVLIERRRRSLPRPTETKVLLERFRGLPPVDYVAFRRDVDAWFDTTL